MLPYLKFDPTRKGEMEGREGRECRGRRRECEGASEETRETGDGRKERGQRDGVGGIT